MILFTSGFPYAGKSEFVRLLLEELGNEGTNIVIEPKSFYPQGFDKLPDAKQQAIGIACWDVCMEETNKAITSAPPTDLIILDTAAKRFHMMRPLFMNAKVRQHKVFYVFIGASADECKKRSEGKWKESFEEDYSNSFATSVPSLKRMSDVFKLIVNNDDLDFGQLREAAKEIATSIQELRT